MSTTLLKIVHEHKLGHALMAVALMARHMIYTKSRCMGMWSGHGRYREKLMRNTLEDRAKLCLG